MESMVTIVIPTWNAAPLLGRCLTSIQSQGFSDWTVLLADSGSSDGTRELGARFARENQGRLRILDCGDCPPGIARNHGIDAADTPYIAFADADDELLPAMLEKLLSRAEETGADIVACDFDMVYPDRIVSPFAGFSDYETKITTDSLANYYLRFCAAPKPNNYVWSRLYRREFLERTGMRFQNVRYSEDHLFNLMLLSKFPHIAHIGQPLYRYIQRDDSAMRQHVRGSDHGGLFLRAFTEAREFLLSTGAPYVLPVLAAYAYTRVKSILFYAWLAGLADDQIHAALETFLAGEGVRDALFYGLTQGILAEYCRLHRYDSEPSAKILALVKACLYGGSFPDMKGIF